MAHHYTTDALIIKTYPSGERHTLVTLFTRNFGLLHVHARSARTSDSKMRGLFTKSLVGLVTLLRGKRAWKIVGVVESRTVYYEIRGRHEHERLLAHVLQLLERLVRGEEKNPQLFDVVCEFLLYLPQASVESLPSLERLTILRVLSTLGYRTPDQELIPLLEDVFITDNVLLRIDGQLSRATREINKALEAAQL